MSQLLKNMMSHAGMDKGNPLNPKRAAIADAITRSFVNKMMPEIKATLQQVEAMKSQPATKGESAK